MARWMYAHDGYGESEYWLEHELTWDKERSCYRVTFWTNDATDAHRLPLSIVFGYQDNPTFRPSPSSEQKSVYDELLGMGFKKKDLDYAIEEAKSNSPQSAEGETPLLGPQPQQDQ